MTDSGRIEALVLYDGVCGLCDRLVRFFLKRDRRDRLRFAPLQGKRAATTLKRFGKTASDLNTMYLILDPEGEQPKLLSRGRAAIRALMMLGGLWKLSYLFLLLPSFLLNRLYNLVAVRRYRWFGKFDVCALPDPQWAWKFIDDEP